MPRPPLIDRDAVLTAALRVADAGGLEAVTMAAVGRELGVTAMALYRHVGDKADLLDGLVERLLGEVPLPEGALAPVDRLAAMGTGIRGVAHAHPHVFPLLLARPAATDEARRRRDLVYLLLEEIGVRTEEVPRLERLISTIVLGFAASEAAGRFAHHPQAVVDGDWDAVGEVVLAMVERAVSRR